MGLEFALVHDATKEAFELGKWCGYEWRQEDGAVPATREEIRAYFQSYFVTGEEWDHPEFVDPVTDAVWAFVESHPGCRVVDEHDYVWREAPDEKDREVRGDAYVFRKVGSRYGIKAVPGHGGEEP